MLSNLGKAKRVCDECYVSNLALSYFNVNLFLLSHHMRLSFPYRKKPALSPFPSPPSIFFYTAEIRSRSKWAKDSSRVWRKIRRKRSGDPTGGPKGAERAADRPSKKSEGIKISERNYQEKYPPWEQGNFADELGLKFRTGMFFLLKTSIFFFLL